MNLETVINRQERLNTNLRELVRVSQELNITLSGEENTNKGEREAVVEPPGLLNKLSSLQDYYENDLAILNTHLAGIQNSIYNREATCRDIKQESRSTRSDIY